MSTRCGRLIKVLGILYSPSPLATAVYNDICQRRTEEVGVRDGLALVRDNDLGTNIESTFVDSPAHEDIKKLAGIVVIGSEGLPEESDGLLWLLRKSKEDSRHKKSLGYPILLPVSITVECGRDLTRGCHGCLILRLICFWHRKSEEVELLGIGVIILVCLGFDGGRSDALFLKHMAFVTLPLDAVACGRYVTIGLMRVDGLVLRCMASRGPPPEGSSRPAGDTFARIQIIGGRVIAVDHLNPIISG